MRFHSAFLLVAFCLLMRGPQALQPFPSPAVPSARFFDSNGVGIRYIEGGQGPAVVLVHGYTGNADRHWVAPGVFASLGTAYRVIALDCRGHGMSDKPTDDSAYGAEMARDVIRLLDHLQLRRAHIIGYSMGAFVAGPLVAIEADRLLSVTFVGHHPLYTWTAGDEAEAEASAHDLESDTPFRRLVMTVPSPGAPRSEAETLNLARQMAAAQHPKALAAYHRGLRRLVVTPAALAASRVPMLAIIGSEDPSVEGVRALKSIVPGLSLVVVPGAEHGGERGVMRRVEFLDAVRKFMSIQ